MSDREEIIRLIEDLEKRAIKGNMVDALNRRIKEAEDIIRAKNELEYAMYVSDRSINWPMTASKLQEAYCSKYGVTLDAELLE